jgi:hypothetical protein
MSDTVAEIQRVSLSERGLSDPLEFVYQHVYDFSPDEKRELFRTMLEYEDGSFEAQCVICASHADERGLTAFIDQYNLEAQKAGTRTVALDSAKKMSRIGHLLRDNNLRMARDFPALSKRFFFEALDANDPIAALQVAQRRVAEYRENPSSKPAYTTRQFRQDLTPKPRKEPEEVEEYNEPEVTLEEKSARAGTFEAPAQDHEYTQFDDEPETPLSRNCYDCKHSWKLTDHHRLGVINVKGTEAIDMVLQEAPVWVCRKHNKIISVYTQNFNRAENMAAGCDFFAEKEDATDVIFSVQTVEDRNRGDTDTTPMSSEEIRSELLGA